MRQASPMIEHASVIVDRMGIRGTPRASRLRRLALVALASLALVIVLAAGTPAGPSESGYLAAAAVARGALRYDRALMWYAAASAAMPTDATPYCLRGGVLALQREWSAAAAADQRCVALDPGRAAGWVALGDALNADGASPVRAWQEAARRGSLDAWRRLAHFAETQGDFAGAEAAWDRLPPDDAEALMHRGLLALERGDTPTARADFVALRATPNAYAELVVDNGLVLLSTQDLTDPVVLTQLGRAFLALNLPRFALAPLRQATALGPDNGEAHALLGWALWLLGQRDAARAEIAPAPRLAPASSFAWFAAGEVALDASRLDAARDDFQRGLDLDAHNPALWTAEAQVYTEQSQYISAELAYTNAAQLSSDPAYTIGLLSFYVDHGFGLQDGRATTAASLAVERFPRNEAIRYLQAQVLDEASQPSFAYYACQAAQQLDPTDPAPYIFLSKYAVAEGNYIVAALELRTALALRPDGPLAGQARQLLAPLSDVGK